MYSALCCVFVVCMLCMDCGCWITMMFLVTPQSSLSPAYICTIAAAALVPRIFVATVVCVIKLCCHCCTERGARAPFLSEQTLTIVLATHSMLVFMLPTALSERIAAERYAFECRLRRHGEMGVLHFPPVPQTLVLPPPSHTMCKPHPDRAHAAALLVHAPVDCIGLCTTSV